MLDTPTSSNCDIAVLVNWITSRNTAQEKWVSWQHWADLPWHDMHSDGKACLIPQSNLPLGGCLNVTVTSSPSHYSPGFMLLHSAWIYAAICISASLTPAEPWVTATIAQMERRFQWGGSRCGYEAGNSPKSWLPPFGSKFWSIIEVLHEIIVSAPQKHWQSS